MPRSELRRQYAKRCDVADFADPEVAALIGRIAPSLDAERPHRKGWEYALAALFLRDTGHLDDASNVLDVGAGAEELLFWLAARVTRIVALDTYGAGRFAGREASARMLEDPAAFAPYPYPRERLEVRRADARRLPFADATFDAVVSLSSIEHFGGPGDVAQAAGEIGRVLRPGVHAFIVTEAFVDMRLLERAPLQATIRLLTAGRLASTATPRRRHAEVLTVREVLARIVSASGLELMQPLQLNLTPQTYDNVIAIADGGGPQPDGAPAYPHVLLQVRGSTFTSLALPLEKPMP